MATNSTSQDNYTWTPNDVNWDYTNTTEDYNNWMNQFYPNYAQVIHPLNMTTQQLSQIPVQAQFADPSVPENATLADAQRIYQERVSQLNANALPVQFNGRLADINRFMLEPVKGKVWEEGASLSNGGIAKAYKDSGLTEEEYTARLQEYWKNVQAKNIQTGVYQPFTGKQADYWAWLSQQPDLAKEAFNPYDEQYMAGINPDLFEFWKRESERFRDDYYGQRIRDKELKKNYREQWIQRDSRIPFQDLGNLSADQQRMFTLIHNPAYGNYYEQAGRYQHPWESPFKKEDYEPEYNESEDTAYLKTIPGAATGIYQSLMRLGRRDIENRYKREFSNLQQKMKYQMGMGEASPLYLQAMRRLIDDRNNAMFNLRMNSGKTAVANALEIAKSSVDLWKTGQEIANDNTKVMHGIINRMRTENREQAKHTFKEFMDRTGLQVDKIKAKQIFNDWRAGRIKEAFEQINIAMKNNQEFMKVLNTMVMANKLADKTVLNQLTDEEKKKWMDAVQFTQAYIGVTNQMFGWGDNQLTQAWIDALNSLSNGGGQT